MAMTGLSWIELGPADGVPSDLGVTVWRVDLDPQREPAPETLAVLDAHEHARLGRYRTLGDRARFAALRAGLRRLLGERLGLAPDRVPIQVDARGRPHLPDERIRFSLAHSGAHGLIGLGGQIRIGVDIEAARVPERLESVTALVLAPAERALWQALPAVQRPDAFLRAWTAKEALLKAAGLGLPGDPTRFLVLSPEGMLAVRGDPAGGPAGRAAAQVYALVAPAGYVAALGVLAPP